MKAGSDETPFDRIESKLAEILEQAATVPGWAEQWKQLGPESTAEQQLAVYQAIRDSGLLPAEAGFFLVSSHIDEITTQGAEDALRPWEDRLKAIERKHGLGDDEFWSRGEAPAEYEEVRREYERAWDGLFADRLEKYGEREMAEFLRADPTEFERRTEAGRMFFFPGPRLEGDSSLPPWVESLFEVVAANMSPESAMGPLGLRYHDDEVMSEVSVYPTPVELVGGAADGEVVAPDFTLDLERLRSAFERIDDFGWGAIGLPPIEGPYVWIEGRYMGHNVCLQVLAYAPDDEEPGMKLDVSSSDRR
jgi:hypothetical protein